MYIHVQKIRLRFAVFVKMGVNMIYIMTAIYAEAQAFIQHFRLKKDISHTRFQVFENKEMEICLIVTGTGSVPAAAALSSICTEYSAGQGDFLLNVGICAGIQGKNVDISDRHYQAGDIFLCSKIKEQSTGRTFYPDILYRHGFKKAQIITGARPYTGDTAWKETESGEFTLYDMEAAAIYQAGLYFFGVHQISFLKIISDFGDYKGITVDEVKKLIGRNMKKIAEYIASLQLIAQEEQQAEFFSKSIVQKKQKQLCEDMHCSTVMASQVKQYLFYCTLAGVDFVSITDAMYQEGKLPCKDKKEGKLRFEELKKRLL